MYCLATCVHDHMLSYIREAKTLKEAWENLRKIFAANTTARRLQLRQELNNIRGYVHHKLDLEDQGAL